MTLKDFGLTPDAIRKHVVAIEPPAPKSYSKAQARNIEAGLTVRGTELKRQRPRRRAHYLHPDLSGLRGLEYEREFARMKSEGKLVESKKHPDLNGYPVSEYKRIVAKRWRDSHPKGASSGSKKIK